jgi:DNA polymerase-3 subunit epsilon
MLIKWEVMSMLETPWKELSFVAFDTETSGPYPLGHEIVEVGLVKWESGREVASFEQLIKPRKPMGQEVIDIHGITNEMVEASPVIDEVIGSIREFIGESILIAHHAPFDLGFLVPEFERFGISLPKTPPLCSSLISRKIIKGTDNHKLQTLVKHFKIEAGPAHRAESDARACLQVALHCFDMIGDQATFQDLLKVQGKDLSWKNYSLQDLHSNYNLKGLLEAIKKDQSVEFIYMSGSMKGRTRKAIPYGVVRSPDGDYLSALCLIDNKRKRFYLNAIRDSMSTLT